MFDFITKYFRKKKTYEMPLSELVTISLNKHSLEELISRIETRKDITDIHPDSQDSQRYVTKMLSEEVEKQFNDERRPLVELVSNAIDAKPKDYEGDYAVDISVGKKSFAVQDRGKPMTLKQLLTTLIIPFETDKDSTRDIGRFGVGFLSNLQYCLDNPNNASVMVETSPKDSTYRLSFQARSSDIRDLTCRIDSIEGSQEGTKVSVKGFNIPSGMGNYFRNYFDFFDQKRATIKLNGKTINNPVMLGFTEYRVPVKMIANGEELEQEARLAISHDRDATKKKKDIKFYSQGVFILDDESLGGAIKVDFPSAVEVVEGRDELKSDSNYNTVLDSVWDKVLEYCRSHGSTRDLGALQNLVYFFHYAKGNKIRHKKEFKEFFFPDKSYAMPSNSTEYQNAISFFGRKIDSEIYSASHWTRQDLWGSEFLNFKDLVERETDFMKRVSKNEIIRREDPQLPPLCNSSLLDGDYDYSLVRIKRFNGGTSPFIHHSNGTVYLNINHPYFTKEGDFASCYGITTSLKGAIGTREKEIEDDLLTGGMKDENKS